MAEPKRSWTYIPPAWSGTQVEGTSFLPIGRYRMPDGSEQVSFGLPQPMLDAVRGLGYASGRDQDPNAPAGYVSQNALMKGGQGLAESAMVGSLGARAPAGALRSGGGWRDRLPKNESDFIDAREYERLLNAPYQGGASSRTTPVDAELPPVGTWRRSPSNLLYGRDIEELTTVPIKDLIAKELVEGKLDPTKRGDDVTYANWLAEGRRAPPIEVMQRADGSFVVMDGHRRLLAAQNAGRDNIEAWVSYDTPTGKVDADGNPMTTSLTYELATNPRNADLDPSQSARMARAKEMGFGDEVWYHGTPDARGLWNEGFRSHYERAGMEDPYAAHFFAADRQTAKTYADDTRAMDYQNANPEVLETRLKVSNPFVLDAGGAKFMGIDKNAVIAAVNELPSGPKRDNLQRAVYSIQGDKLPTDAVVGLARRFGFDAVDIKNVIDTYTGEGSPTTVRAVFNPRNIRSVNAMFDPAKSDSANLLAANPLAGAVPLAWRQPQEDERPIY